MRMLDEQYFKTPFYGVRHLKVWLQKQGPLRRRNEAWPLSAGLPVPAKLQGYFSPSIKNYLFPATSFSGFAPKNIAFVKRNDTP
jgi:hypothetical protein